MASAAAPAVGAPRNGAAAPARLDGRNLDELRPLFIQTGIITQASGSAYVEAAQAKVVCAVHGPRPTIEVEYAESGKVSCDVRYAPFAKDAVSGSLDAPAVDLGAPSSDGTGSGGGSGVDKTRRGGLYGGYGGNMTRGEQAVSEAVVAALSPAILVEKFPKSDVSIHVIVLEDGGSALALAITAASLAVANAAVEMRGLVTACSAAVYHSLADLPAPAPAPAPGGAASASTAPASASVSASLPAGAEAFVVLDPSRREVRAADAELLVAAMPAMRDVTLLEQHGCPLSIDTVSEAVRFCTDGCVAIHRFVGKQLLADLPEAPSGKPAPGM